MMSSSTIDYRVLPHGEKKKALRVSHFPTHFQAVIWRNWGLVPFERIARILKTTADEVQTAGGSLGLAVGDFDFEQWAHRGYLTIIRKNWHLLNYEQLCELLDWSPDRLAFVLREDDFCWVKMGNLKPEVDFVYYRDLTPEEIVATNEINQEVSRIVREIPRECDRPFTFLQQFGKKTTGRVAQSDELRLIYSYSALYGDPLFDESVDPLPDELLAEYAERGINAVWMQAILYTLVPWLGEKPAIGRDKRIESLIRLVAKAKKYGIKIYLYLNEPRGAPVKYFEEHPEWGGAITSDGNQAFCTQNPKMLEALSGAIQLLCESVREIGGFFAITQSENITHCLSRPTDSFQKECPVCSKEKNPVKGITSILTAINDGIKSSGIDADLIAWSWAWSTEWDEDVLKNLPKEVRIQCVSETDLETDCMGIKGKVLDYSISKVGPGATAKRLWSLARKHHHEVIAKIQINTTWENFTLPYIPVPQLVKRHLVNLQSLGVNNFMLSWTLGGYPGGNLELLDLGVEELAAKKFGPQHAAKIVEIWDFFCRGFEQFPFNSVDMIYFGPQSVGPANLLICDKSNYSASMCGFPYDDLKSWSGDGFYPEEVLENTFLEMSTLIGAGLQELVFLESQILKEYIFNYWDLRNVAEAFYCNIRSSYLQIAFIRSRGKDSRRIIEILTEEEELAKRLLIAQSRDSRIGFEATNHYMYLQNDLIEKALNCQDQKRRVLREIAISCSS